MIIGDDERVRIMVDPDIELLHEQLRRGDPSGESGDG